MKKNIHFFDQGEANVKPQVLERIGIRGRLAMELADLDLPILPGFVIDADVAAHLGDFDIWGALRPWFDRLAKLTGKTFGDADNPMLVKIVVSPNLVIASYPTLHNFGLTDKTLPGFNRYVGENFGWHELQFLTRGSLEIEMAIAELENKEKEAKSLKQAIKELDAELNSEMDAKKRKASIERYKAMLPKGYFADPFDQLEIALKRISHLLAINDQNQEDTALLIQPMVYGNYGKDSSQRPVLHPQHRHGRQGDPGRILPEQVQRHRHQRLGHRQDRQELPCGAGEDRAQGGRPLQGDPLHPVHGGEQAALADRPALRHDQVHPGRHPAPAGPARAQDRGRRATSSSRSSRDSSTRSFTPSSTSRSVKGLPILTGGITGAPGRRHRQGVLHHGRAPGGAQARAAEGPGHEADPLPRCLPLPKMSRQSRSPPASSPRRAATRPTPRSSPASTARSPS